MSSTPKETSSFSNSTFVLDGGDFQAAFLPTRIIGYVVIALLLRYSILNFGDTTTRNPIMYFSLLLGISLGVYMLTVHPATALVARNAQALKILEDFIEDEDKRIDFLVELKLHKEGTIIRPVNGNGSATFHLKHKDKISTLKISQ
jgi:hypothetical protein